MSHRKFWTQRCAAVVKHDSLLTRLFTPGKCFHLIVDESATCCGSSCYGFANFSCAQGNVLNLKNSCIWKSACGCGNFVRAASYRARFIEREELQEILVEASMIDDHLPHKLGVAIKSAITEESEADPRESNLRSVAERGGEADSENAVVTLKNGSVSISVL